MALGSLTHRLPNHFVSLAPEKNAAVWALPLVWDREKKEQASCGDQDPGCSRSCLLLPWFQGESGFRLSRPCPYSSPQLYSPSSENGTSPTPSFLQWMQAEVEGHRRVVENNVDNVDIKLPWWACDVSPNFKHLGFRLVQAVNSFSVQKASLRTIMIGSWPNAPLPDSGLNKGTGVPVKQWELGDIFHFAIVSKSCAIFYFWRETSRYNIIWVQTWHCFSRKHSV